MNLSAIRDLKSATGRKVRNVYAFSAVPAGAIGVIRNYIGSADCHESIEVEWEEVLSDGKCRRDAYGRNPDFDETQFLEVI